MNTTGPLTIALVMATPGTGWGGMEKHTADLAAALSERGHKVHLLAHKAYSHRFAESVQVHSLPVQLDRRNPWLKHRLRRALKSITPDIVHAQGNKAASLVGSIPRTSGNRSTRILGTLHGTKSSHRAFNQLDGVIGVSREIESAVNHPNKRLIYNGLKDKEPDSPDPNPGFPIPRERPLLLAAGRLEPVKQFDRLIRAWAQSASPGTLVILGDGSQRSQLESLISQSGAGDRILLPGHEPRVLPWLKAATACIISSSREGFPYIMVEALRAECPVLSTPVSGVRDFLPDSAIASSDSVEDIADLVTANLGVGDSTPGSLSARFQSSFQRAAEQLSLETMVSKTEHFYRELLGANATGR
ncbi:glycosyltransferase [Marinobacter confluentis]|uniref:Glycosyltransferase n=1 Tax=Marinobacter confluentis TaxID=1697557 RepID=A0A4Z1BV74_9GAMM|nr:glycosyltransferase [Marinobacter confluentis]TGN38517.1 glycosyltransferase [Marinobacter confluentis]